MSFLQAVEDLGLRQFVSKDNKKTITAHCFHVNFHRALKTSDRNLIDTHITTRNILHSVVALYNSNLPNIDPNVLYSSICNTNSWTLVALVSAETALDLLCSRKKCDPELDLVDEKLISATESKDVDEEVPREYFLQKIQKTYSEFEEEKAQQVCPNCRPSKFSRVFSDEEDEVESELESEASEDFGDDHSSGADQFLAEVAERKYQRKKHLDATNKVKLSSMNVENRLIAALTFERSFAIKSEKVYHITVLSVRKPYRKHGLGQFLVEQVKERKARNVDLFDTLAVLADSDAVGFFEKQNFTQDSLICSRYEDLRDTWTDCTVMVFIPSCFDARQVDLDVKLEFVEKEQELLLDASLKQYQQNFGLITRLKNEVIATQRIIEMQNKIIYSLIKETNAHKSSNITGINDGCKFDC